MEENHQNLLIFIDKVEDFTEIVVYQNSKGNPFETSIEDILQHLLLHSAYHRGQVVAQLKMVSEDLPSTDYIFYVRQLS